MTTFTTKRKVPSGFLPGIIEEDRIMPVSVDNDKCEGCGDCVEECPSEALEVVDSKVKVNDECIDCYACIEACPTNALSEGE